MCRLKAAPFFPSCLLLPLVVTAQSLDVSSTDAIKSSAKSIASGLVSHYPGSQPGNAVGVFDSSYEWWESGAVWGSLIDYWAVSGDSEYNSLVQDAMVSQVLGPSIFMPTNQSSTESNAAQTIWALSALSAAEQKFPVPSGMNWNWTELAVQVFNQQVARWDNLTCGGGLHEPIYNYSTTTYRRKDGASIATFIQMAARLALLTRNGTYADWADKAYNWAAGAGLIDGSSYAIYNSVDSAVNCSAVSQQVWSLNVGALLYASALRYNFSNSQSWVTRTQNFVTYANRTFFQETSSGVTVIEASCGGPSSCTNTQRAYRALLLRWMARSAMAAPFATSAIQSLLSQSAKTVAKTCTSESNSTCTVGGGQGLGEQMAALDLVQGLLVGGSGGIGSGTGASSATSASGSATPSATGKSEGARLGVVGLSTCMMVAGLVASHFLMPFH